MTVSSQFDSTYHFRDCSLISNENESVYNESVQSAMDTFSDGGQKEAGTERGFNVLAEALQYCLGGHTIG